MAEMKMYDVSGSLFWFHEGDQPKGAKEVKGKAPANKEAAEGKANKGASAAKANMDEAADGKAE